MANYIFDTNFISALFFSNDRNHKESKKIFANLKADDNIYIPYIVAAELLASESEEDVVGYANHLVTKFAENKEIDLKFIKKLPPKLRSNLKANDCLILSLCDRLNAKLFTFDRKLARIAKDLR